MFPVCPKTAGKRAVSFEIGGVINEEYKSLRTQFATLETGRGKFSKYLPFAFTEHGLVMLLRVIYV
ncbi:MAG: ORF6N domain-containing protein [Lewinellaceae bacterium]|nr:ORF6N domain-containing protein [Lewinellaceae bacterium]